MGITLQYVYGIMKMCILFRGLAKKKHYLTNDHWTLPYILDEKTLKKKKKQPKFTKALASKGYIDFFLEENTAMKDFAHHQVSLAMTDVKIGISLKQTLN